MDYDSLACERQAEIDEICDRFESELKKGHRPRPGDLVDSVELEVRESLVCELLSIELHHGKDAHQQIQSAYHTTFPEFGKAIRTTCLTHSSSLRPGTGLGEFRVEQQIGAGGMGVVFEAYDVKLERQVALKMLPDVFSEDRDRLKRFDREAKLLASLNHPNVATLHGFEEHDGRRFLVMELVAGDSLADIIGGKPPELDEGVRLFCQIAEALEFAHQRGVIHRDLKPTNIKTAGWKGEGA